MKPSNLLTGKDLNRFLQGGRFHPDQERNLGEVHGRSVAFHKLPAALGWQGCGVLAKRLKNTKCHHPGRLVAGHQFEVSVRIAAAWRVEKLQPFTLAGVGVFKGFRPAGDAKSGCHGAQSKRVGSSVSTWMARASGQRNERRSGNALRQPLAMRHGTSWPMSCAASL